MDQSAKHAALIKSKQKYGLGRLFLHSVYDDLKNSLTPDQKNILPSLSDFMRKVYRSEYVTNRFEHVVLSTDSAPKIEFFNAIAQYYRDFGMHEKAMEVNKKCQEWLEKYSLE